MSFVWAGNARKFLVNSKGRVKNNYRVTIQPKRDLEGYLYVEWGGARYYVHELVIQNHGKPPHKNRLPKPGEVVVFVDGNQDNVAIENLEYRQKESAKHFKSTEGVPDAVEDYVWQLLKEGKTYNQIQDMVAVSNYSNRTISASKISDIRRERSEKAFKGKEILTPSEKQGLKAVKKSLGETDDAEATRQVLAEKETKKRAEAAKAKQEKEEKEAEKEKAEEVIEDAIGEYHAQDEGHGWWGVYQGTEKLNGKNYREKDVKAMVETLKGGGKAEKDLLEAFAVEREKYKRNK